MATESKKGHSPEGNVEKRPAKLRSTKEQIANVTQGVLDGQLTLDNMSPELQEVIARFIQQQKDL